MTIQELTLIQDLFAQKQHLETFLEKVNKKFPSKETDFKDFNVSISVSDKYSNLVASVTLNDRDAVYLIEDMEVRLDMLTKEIGELSVFGLEYLPQELRPFEPETATEEE